MVCLNRGPSKRRKMFSAVGGTFCTARVHIGDDMLKKSELKGMCIHYIVHPFPIDKKIGSKFYQLSQFSAVLSIYTRLFFCAHHFCQKWKTFHELTPTL